MTGRVVGGWIALVCRHPVRVLSGVLLLVALAAGAATGLKIDSDSSRMLSPDLPFQKRTLELNAAFPTLKNTMLVVVRAPSADAADMVTESLTKALTRLSEVGGVFAPSADPHLVSHGLLYEDVESLDRRLTRLSKSADFLAELRSDQSVSGFFRALDRVTGLAAQAELSPAALGRIYREAALSLAAVRKGGAPHPFPWSEVLGDTEPTGGTLRVISVEPRFDYSRLSPAKDSIRAVRRAISGLPDEVRALAEIGLTGDPVLRSEEMQSVLSRLWISLVLSVLLVALVLGVAMRRSSRVLATLATLGATLIVTTGFAALLPTPLNLVSIAFVVLMVGLGVDFAIHFLAEVTAHSPSSRDIQPVLVGSGRMVGAALLLAAITTSASFLAFTTTDFIGLAQFGVIGAFGVVAAFAMTITLLPALARIRPSLIQDGVGSASRRLRRLVSSLMFYRSVTVAAAALALASLVLVPSSHFDADPMALRDPNAPSVETFGWLKADPQRTPLRLSVLADSPEEAAAIASRASDLAEVSKAVWLGKLVPEDQADKLDLIDLAYPSIVHAIEGEPAELTTAEDDPLRLAERLERSGGSGARILAGELRLYAAARTVELDRVAAATMFRFFPQLLHRLALQLEADEITVESLPGALVERYRTPDGIYRVEIVPAEDVSQAPARARLVEAVAAIAPDVAGPLVQIQGAAGVVSAALLQALGLSSLASVGLAWLWLRRVTEVLAVLVPLVCAAAVTAAAGVLLDLPFNYANIIVIPLMIGIGVDSGIHLALRARAEGAGVFTSPTPRAVVFSALTTIAAFATLGLSAHRGTASMGILLAIAVAAAVLMAMALTPRLIFLSARLRA